MLARPLRAFALLVAATFVACANLRIDTRHESAYDFAKLSTYAFTETFPAPAVAGGDDAVDVDQVNPRIAAEIVRVLGSRGYTRTSPEEADVIVHFQAGTWAKQRLDNQLEGIEGRLRIRLVDRARNETVWEGHAHESWYADMDSAVEIRRAVDKLFADFPPPPGAPNKTKYEPGLQ